MQFEGARLSLRASCSQEDGESGHQGYSREPQEPSSLELECLLSTFTNYGETDKSNTCLRSWDLQLALDSFPGLCARIHRELEKLSALKIALFGEEVLSVIRQLLTDPFHRVGLLQPQSPSPFQRFCLCTGLNGSERSRGLDWGLGSRTRG